MPAYPPRSALRVAADAPDLRDRYYEPLLAPLQPVMHPPGNLRILNQGREGACTGFGLAATINLLYRKQGAEYQVSPRMLYDNARRYDEWPGEDYVGSSCRGAIKGWKNSGVCLEELAPYVAGQEDFTVTPEIAEDARKRTIGAYYRIRPNITDMHSALNETGVIYVSARVHKGWRNPSTNEDGEPFIRHHRSMIGGHAFAIVGYNEDGFWIQNSWGEEDWGKGGLAIWLYTDWAENVQDAWAVQLALPTPNIFSGNTTIGSGSEANRSATFGATPRQEIERHFVHLDDGSYHDKGRYWSNRGHMALVQQQLRTAQYNHLVLYAHGGLNSLKASAKRIAAMKNVFLANGIYPFHFMYDTGLFEELKDIIIHKRDRAERITGPVSEWFDRRIEDLSRKAGRAIWREMKYGAEKPFSSRNADGSDAVHRLISTVRELDRDVKIHTVGHSTGAILHAHLMSRARKLFPDLTIESCSLLAPAATNRLFNQIYKPLLKRGRIEDLTIYNLAKKLELDDHVAQVYRKSLLYLVSRAFEEKEEDKQIAELLGMQIYNDKLKLNGLPVEFVYSRGKRGRTSSTSHGGFDNDPNTLNDIMKRVLGRKPEVLFTDKDLDY